MLERKTTVELSLTEAEELLKTIEEQISADRSTADSKNSPTILSAIRDRINKKYSIERHNENIAGAARLEYGLMELLDHLSNEANANK